MDIFIRIDQGSPVEIHDAKLPDCEIIRGIIRLAAKEYMRYCLSSNYSSDVKRSLQMSIRKGIESTPAYDVLVIATIPKLYKDVILTVMCTVNNMRTRFEMCSDIRSI